MKRMIKITAWLMAVSLMASFILIPAKPTFAATVYKYEWVSQSGTVSPDGYAHQYTGLKAGDSIPLSLTLINRSGTTIVGKSVLPTIPGYQVPIGTWGVGTQNPQDGTPYFLDPSSFILNNNRFVYYDGADVPDGGYLSLNWTIKLASNLTDGVYDLYYRPVCEYLAWTRQVKNGYTLPGTDSDIFTRFVVGSGDDYSLRLAFANKFDRPITEVAIIVNARVRDYVRGNASLAKDGDENVAFFGFFAVKQNSEWIIAYSGHDRPVCEEVAQYNFPSEIMDSCYSLVEKKVITR